MTLFDCAHVLWQASGVVFLLVTSLVEGRKVLISALEYSEVGDAYDVVMK